MWSRSCKSAYQIHPAIDSDPTMEGRLRVPRIPLAVYLSRILDGSEALDTKRSAGAHRLLKLFVAHMSEAEYPGLMRRMPAEHSNRLRYPRPSYKPATVVTLPNRSVRGRSDGGWFQTGATCALRRENESQALSQHEDQGIRFGDIDNGRGFTRIPLQERLKCSKSRSSCRTGKRPAVDDNHSLAAIARIGVGLGNEMR